MSRLFTDFELSGTMPTPSGSIIARPLPKHGNGHWKVIIQPAIEPVELSELKEFSRITTNAEDSFLLSAIKLARFCAESFTGKAFIEQKIKLTMDWWPGNAVELPMPPLISVSKVATLDESGTETEYDSDNYYYDAFSMPGRLIIKGSQSQPVNTDRDYAGYAIEYFAGFGANADDVDPDLKMGVLLWAAHYYANRVIDPKNPPPEAKSALSGSMTASMMVR